MSPSIAYAPPLCCFPVTLETPNAGDVSSWVGLDLCCHPSNTPNTWGQAEKAGAAIRQLIAAARGSLLTPPTSYSRSVCCQNNICDVLADYMSIGGACHTHELRIGAAGDVSAVSRFECCCCKNEGVAGVFVQVRAGRGG